MAKVLSSISLDAPSSPVSANVDDTFAFTGTPGFTGSGGVQRYDFKWEVNDGGGWVTIASSATGLITTDTNPVVNTNSQSANSITVTCDQAGSYTIRMAGAPTSGGSYTVLSATQTVEVTGSEPHTGSAVLTGGGIISHVYIRASLATPVLTGAGVVTTTLTSGRERTQALTGGGTMAYVTLSGHSGGWLMTGGGVLTATQDADRLVAVLFTGGGTIIGLGLRGALSVNALSGGGVLTYGWVREAFLGASLTGGGVLEWGVYSGHNAIHTLTGGGRLMVGAEAGVSGSLLMPVYPRAWHLRWR